MYKFIFVFAVLLSVVNVGWAEMYDVVVVETYVGGQTLKVEQVDNITSETNYYFVSISPETEILGSDSALPFEVGDALTLDADETDAGQLFAKRVSVTEASEDRAE